jgi:photosynthetic reaction center cytochrome c subunit
MNFRILMTAAVIGVFGLFVIIGTFHLPPVQSVQTGYRGTGMAQLFHPPALEATQAANRAPEVSPAIPPSGTLAGEQFKNVQVLKDIDANEFLRLMTEITAWVSPQQGCAYCHREGEDLSSDSLYTKIVSRRMIEMTRAINTRWKDHVGGTGVNCYTCHRGHPVPPYAWYGSAPESAGMSGAGIALARTLQRARLATRRCRMTSAHC